MRRLCFLLLVVTQTLSANCGSLFAEDSEDPKSLARLKLPKLSMFVGRMDVPVEEVVGWMNAIDSQLKSGPFDCRVKAELSYLTTATTSGSPVLMRRSIAFRRAADPSKRSERYVSVSQNPMDNLEIALNSGAAEDNSLHFDVLRIGDKKFVATQYAFDAHVSREDSSVDWDRSSLDVLRIFDPIRACTATVQAVIYGFAVDASSHNVHSSTVTGTLKEGEYVHALVELGLVNKPPSVRLVHTFKGEVPVQFARVEIVQREGKDFEEITEITRSRWMEVKSDGEIQFLPVEILGSVAKPQHVGEMHIVCDWSIGEKVNEGLFRKETLGNIIPAEGVMIGVPKLLQEILESSD